jgi:dTDP-4-dehydrorhamnose 3,5-epimerase
MQVTESSNIHELRVIQVPVFRDFRGEYVETFSARNYALFDANGKPIEFVEDDVSMSRRGVLRGLHGDDRTWKLVQCLWGEFYLIVADVRPHSPTYLRWEGFYLNDRNRSQVLIPAGCANGHLCMTEHCLFSYKQSQYYDGADKQFTVRWDDPALAISWPIRDPLLSQRDAGAKFLQV